LFDTGQMDDMSKIEFGIYVAGPVARNLPVINAFKEVCAQNLATGSYEIMVVDATKNPLSAEQKKIMALPTIIRQKPLPERRIIGDTRLPEKALSAFEFLMEELQMTMK
jgi:circadian clock protein KaiB